MAIQEKDSSRIKEMFNDIIEFGNVSQKEITFLKAMGNMMEETKIITIIELAQACDEYFKKHYN